MEITSSKNDASVVLALSGRMDAVAAPQFEQTCETLIKSGEKSIVADLAHLSYISSMGLGSLLSVAKKMQTAGGSFSVRGAVGMVKEVFRYAGFDKMFPGFDSVHSAAQKN